MSQVDLMSINTVAARLGLSVHQLRRWELMFNLEIKRGRGQQRQYRPEDITILERIKELVDQGWPTSQIRPQLESEGLITPKLIGLPAAPSNTDALMESIIGLRNFSERRFIDLSKQVDELRQLLISLSLRQELQGDESSPWQPVMPEALPSTPSPPAPVLPPQEIAIGPGGGQNAPVEKRQDQLEVTDQNYLTLLGKMLDRVGWSDEQADEFSNSTFGISHWDELGRSQAEKLISYLQSLTVESTSE